MSDPNPNIPANSPPFPTDKPETGVTANPPAVAPAANPAAVTTKPAAAAPPKPAAKPAAKGKDRRGFLYAMLFTWIGIAWTTMTASLALMTLGTVRFLFPNVLSEPPSTFRAGTPADVDSYILVG